MSIGFLSFLTPLALIGLLTLPAIWWLLRLMPPSPSRQLFPPTKILKELTQDETTSAHSPWWLTLLRLIAAACLIFALSEPVLNNDDPLRLKKEGPVVLFVDNGWSSASYWEARLTMMKRIIRLAQDQERLVVLQFTAPSQVGTSNFKLNPLDAMKFVERLEPEPFTPKREAALTTLIQELDQINDAQIYWLSDGLAFEDEALLREKFSGLRDMGHQLSIVAPDAKNRAIGLIARLGKGGVLHGEVIASPHSEVRTGVILALSSREEILARVPFKLDAGAQRADTKIELPLELRNQITKLKIEGSQSSASVFLLDKRSSWRRIGLISGESEEIAQPLLSPLYYIRRALEPYSETIISDSKDALQAIEAFQERNASVIVMADIGLLIGEPFLRLTEWVEKGGVLVRFAGPHMEENQDELLPSPLRKGGRRLGGALSWATPQPLAEFDENSPFAGLEVPKDVFVKRQVLTDPSQITDKVLIWARLKDGTPLVTASREVNGWVVLVHVTANSDWSNLPLSGLFVEMLRRLSELSTTPIVNDSNGEVKGKEDTQLLLPPLFTLNGFGVLGTPPAISEPLTLKSAMNVKIEPKHPPGLYGSETQNIAVNVLSKKDKILSLNAKFDGAEMMSYTNTQEKTLKGPLFLLALALLFIDSFIVLAIRGLFTSLRLRPAIYLIAFVSISIAATPPLQAEERAGDKQTSKIPVEVLLKASLKTHLAYVQTNNQQVDKVSQDGLKGLSYILNSRTAVEPQEPMAVNIEQDELSFFPILYWPVGPFTRPLSDQAAAKINSFMKFGGMIIFDTKDQNLGIGNRSNGQQTPLQKLLSKLDIPRLEPVPQGHVLTKSFYLLSSFPGRYRGGELWVEAGLKRKQRSNKVASNVDGVSSLLITSNDFASAWALDQSYRPLYAVVPGGDLQREMAYRVGVNIVMYALAGNYKADQVHVPALLERLGQ